LIQVLTSVAIAASGLAVDGGTAAAGIDNADGSKVDVFDSVSVILPTATTRGASAVRLTAARNEYESFQLKISAATRSISDVSVSLGTPLVGPNGASIPSANVRFYRQEYYKLTTMSDGEMATEFPRDPAGTCLGDCRVPDALIPERDVLTDEDRAAFPMAVPLGENRAVWVDVLVPPTASPGTYTGSVAVTSGVTRLSTVPVTLEVLNASIPSTATMRSQVYVNSQDIGGSLAVYQQLARLGLSNRISVVPTGFDPVAASPVLGPLLNGSDAKVPLAGARLTQLPLTRWDDMARWRTVLTQLGRTDVARFWCDEVSTATCAGWYSTAAVSFPGLKLQQIPQYQKPVTDPDFLDGRTHTAVPIVTGLDPKLSWFQQWKSAVAGRELWAYTSCMSAGCNAPYAEYGYTVGVPSLGIDQPASQIRSMGWQGFRVGLDGEHYWNATGAYKNSWNDCVGLLPTNCQYTAAGEATGMNGDGNLFYAWNQAKVGGATPIPIESIRLKRFRDGREDNELLNLVAARGRRADALTVANGLFPSFSQNTRTAAQVVTARTQLEGLVRTSYPASRPTAQDLNCDGESDMLGVAHDGRLLVYTRQNGDWQVDTPIVAASGWLGKYKQLLLPGDLNGDGTPDLLGRTTANTLDVWNGNCKASFVRAASLPATFSVSDPSTPGDFDGDGKPDLLDRRADGTLWLASGTGANSFVTPRQIGSGWTSVTAVGIGDANSDGLSDVIGRRSDGRVFLYRGNGRGGWLTGKGEDTGLTLPLGTMPRVLGPGDVTADRVVDLVALTSGGELVAYAGTGSGGFAAIGRRIGGGWNSAIVQIAD
jgi:hypothetical protein